MLKDYQHVSLPPRSLKYGGVYWATQNMITRFTVETLHTKRNRLPPLELFKRIGGEDGDSRERILIPRACCPVPSTNDYRSRGLAIDLESNVVPRDASQVKFLRECKYLFKQEESYVAEAPTGFGKTIMACDLIAYVNRTTLIVVHKEDIETQWRAAFKKHLGLTDNDIGLIKGNTVRVRNKKVVIAYVQSICKEGRYPDYIYDYFGFIIVDEVHKIGADKFSQMAWLFSSQMWFGLSATPYRKDGNDIIIHAHIGSVKVKVKTMALVPKVITVATNYKIPRRQQRNTKTGEIEVVQIPHGNGRTGQVAKLMEVNEERNGIIGEFVESAYRKGRYTLILAETLSHLDTLEDEIVLNGVKRSDIARYVGGMTEAQREKAKTKPVCLATFKMTESATDNPIWDTLVMSTPRADVVQIVGRILRVHDRKCSAVSPVLGKNIPVVLDLIDIDSPVYREYYKKRLKWYKSIKASIV